MKKRLGALLLIVSVALSLVVPVHGAAASYAGIDVSVYNGNINWSTVKNSGIDFAMIRDGIGGDPGYWDVQKDTKFEQNYSGAVQNGVKVGAYHYSYATNVTMASQEADECLYILKGRHLDLPVAYDLEDKCQKNLSTQLMGQIVQTFCEKIRKAGYRVVIYSSVDFYNNHLTSPLVSRYNTWIAHWTDASAPNFSDYTMWQYADDGTVPGISGACDLDYRYPTFQSDTSSYSFGSSSEYTYKITTDDYSVPTAVSSNPNAVSVSAARNTTDGYLFTIKNNGIGDAVITTTSGDGSVSVPLQASGSRYFSCDTSSYSFGTNSQYTYKISTNDLASPQAVSSNPSAISVSNAIKISDGYLFTITKLSNSSATVTTTSGDGSKTASFGVTPVFQCDTGSYTFGSNSQYTFKIRTSDSNPPAATSSNPSVVGVSGPVKVSDGYLYTIYNKGTGTATIATTASDGSSASFQATGTFSLTVQSDTPYYFTMQKGTAYQFKFTGAPGVAYSFACAGSTIIKSVSLNKIDGSYYFKVYAAGSGSAGMYATTTGYSQRVGIVTVP